MSSMTKGGWRGGGSRTETRLERERGYEALPLLHVLVHSMHRVRRWHGLQTLTSVAVIQTAVVTGVHHSGARSISPITH